MSESASVIGRVQVPVLDRDRARVEVEAAARDLVAAVTVGCSDRQQPPLDPLWFADHLGIRVVEVAASQMRVGETFLDGLLMPKPGGFAIFLNREVRSARRRAFSLAHEVAHTFFSNAAEAAQMRAKGLRVGDLVESLADAGAAELLMPRSWFEAGVARLGRRAAAVPALAGCFGVSLSATARRLVETSPEPITVAFFADGTRSDGSGPWAYRAVPGMVFRGEGAPFLFPPGKSVPNDSLVVRASLRTEEVDGEEELRLGPERHRLRVSACPIHRDPGVVAGPPLVVAVLGGR